MNHRPSDVDTTGLCVCDHCGQIMAVEANTCSKCGATFDAATPRRKNIPTTPFEKLDWLSRRAFSLHISTNDHHRGRIGGKEKSPTVEEWSELEQYDFEDEAVKAECFRLQHVVHVQCYPSNSVGFYSSDHYDLAKAIEEIFDACHREISLRSKQG